MIDKLLDKLNIPQKKKGIIKGAIFLVIVALIAFLWNLFIMSPVKISGKSMNPALAQDDIVIVNKLEYLLGDVERYDIIMFPYKYDKSRQFIKRVIALPGETIEIKSDKIYINGEPLNEFYGVHNNDLDIQNFGPVTLLEDEYFVMGDNRDNSDDSRSNDVGFIKESDIIGKVIFRLAPYNSFGSLKGQ